MSDLGTTRSRTQTLSQSLLPCCPDEPDSSPRTSRSLTSPLAVEVATSCRLEEMLWRNHSDACRVRIENELQKSEHGKDRLGRARDRLDAKTAEMMEEMIVGPSRPKEVRHRDDNGGTGTSSRETQGEMPSTRGPDGSTQDAPVDMPVDD